MELIQLSLLALGMIMLMGVVLSVPWWLKRFVWYRCLENWLLYRRLIPCEHRAAVLQRCHAVPPDLPDLYALVCPECQTIFLQDTWENFEAALVRVPWWHRVVHCLKHGGGA